MLHGLIALLVFQLAGEAVVTATGLPVPGPVVGMVLLLGWLQWRRPPDTAGTVRASDALLRHLQLWFVPAGVGVLGHLALLRADVVPVSVALAVSWLAGLATVGWTVGLLARGSADG